MSITVNKSWMPAEYQDEAVPPARPSPSAWVEQLAENAYVLQAAFPDEDFGPQNRPLTNGEAVKFQWTSAIITVVFRRGYDKPIFWPMVEGAETMALQKGDSDTIISDAQALERFIADEHEFSETVEIEFYCWSNDIVFIFRGGEFHPAEEGAA